MKKHLTNFIVDLNKYIIEKGVARTHNRRLAKKRVQRLIEHSTSYQLLCWVDSCVLRKSASSPSAITLPPSQYYFEIDSCNIAKPHLKLYKIINIQSEIMRLLNIILFILFIIGCSNEIPSNELDFYNKIKNYNDSIPNNRIAIIKKFPFLSKQLDFLKTEDSASYFCSLKNFELVETEYLLRHFLCKSNHENISLNRNPIQIEKYYRQYVAFINKNGDKIIWVNCFCGEEPMNFWKYAIIHVNDGGDCFFKIEINLTTKELIYLAINGSA